MAHKKIGLVVLFSIIIVSQYLPLSLAVDISAKAAVVLCAETREVLFEKNAHTPLPMASTTKIMTALLACESGRMEELVTISPAMCGAEGTSMELQVGDVLRLRDLVYGMLLASGNDAADATAIFLRGDKALFAAEMNRKAAQLGLSETHFVTPSGLDAEGHRTTAYDLAVLTAAAVENPQFRAVCSAKNATIDFISPPKRVTLTNHNRLLSQESGVFGVKTGFTKKSGRCLVTAAQRNGATLIAVTLNDPNDWDDHTTLLNDCFAKLQMQRVSVSAPQMLPVCGGTAGKTTLLLPNIVLPHNAPLQISTRVVLPRFVYAPLRKGDVVGFVQVFSGETLLRCVPITAGEDIPALNGENAPKLSWFTQIIRRLRPF